ncbi:unnamed protein product, partial [Gulo gulo]
ASYRIARATPRLSGVRETKTRHRRKAQGTSLLEAPTLSAFRAAFDSNSIAIPH